MLFALSLLLIGNYKFYKNGFHERYLSPESTEIIKGIFIALIFCGHFAGYVKFGNPLDRPFFKVYWYMGQFVVAMFLLYSGYGLMISIKNKGMSYVKKLPTHRILKTLLHFDLAVSMYMIIYMIKNGLPSVEKFGLAMVGWDGFGNSNWYIFAIISIWCVVYALFRICGVQNLEWKLFLCFVGICFLAFIISQYKPIYWYDTMICFPLGMWVALYKERIEEFLFPTFLNIKKFLRGGLRWHLITVCFILATILLGKYKGNFYLYECWMLVFAFGILLLTMKFEFHSKVLSWLGRNLFEVYILQRIPMILLQPYMVGHNYRYFVSCIVCTLVLVVIFKKVMIKIDGWLFGC